MPSVSVQCYNRGCGAKFVPDENHKDACTYHSGKPFFHDAYKGWSCCGKKTIDFTEFLNTKGCTKGFHCDIKPEEPLIQPVVDIPDTPEPEVRPPQPVSVPRPSFNSPLVKLKTTVGASLTQALQKAEQSTLTSTTGTYPAGQEPPGTSCTNHGCTQKKGSCSDECCYHHGVPVFHEGMKYWSCCQQKTSDFNSFLSQRGCTTGEHCWSSKKTGDSNGGSNCPTVRHDWHQTGGDVCIALYTRCADPSQCVIEAGPVRLRVHVVFDGGRGFDQDWELFDTIDPVKSSVQLLASKVEIKLRKANLTAWKSVAISSHLTPPTATNTEQQQQQTQANSPDINTRVDAIDLSDL